MKTEKTHWTNRSVKDFAFSIAADFIVQLENKMESPPISQKELAEKIGVTKGYISQKFHNPGNLSLETIVEFCRSLNMKVAIVAYDDNDPNNDNGPIHSDIFRICWEKADKPRDFWAFEKQAENNLSSENHFILTKDFAANNDVDVPLGPLVGIEKYKGALTKTA